MNVLIHHHHEVEAPLPTAVTNGRVRADQAHFHEQIADVLRILCNKDPQLTYDHSHCVAGLYMQERHGQHHEPMMVVKIQSMPKHSELLYKELVETNGVDETGTILNDPRPGPVGKFLRKTKLDEIPQIVQWLTGLATGKGKLSFLGIRPQITHDWEDLNKEDQTLQDRVLRWKPGFLAIDHALPRGASKEERMALWNEYDALCAAKGQLKANMSVLPRVLRGSVMRLFGI